MCVCVCVCVRVFPYQIILLVDNCEPLLLKGPTSILPNYNRACIIYICTYIHTYVCMHVCTVYHELTVNSTMLLQIWLDDVKCSGDESSLFSCQHSGFGVHNCHHYEDTSVVCTGRLLPWQ